VDIDHIEKGARSIESLKTILMTDKRVHMLFCSPSNDGLKVMFMLEEPFYDAAQYSIFYKVFTRNFAIQYNIEDIVDTRTSDVTRACFLSADPDAYFNETCERIVCQNILNFDNVSEVESVQKQIKEEEKKQYKTSEGADTEVKVSLQDEQIKKIKEKLGMRVALQKPEKQYYVPEELERIIGLIKTEVEDLGITLKSVSNINYGKKFVFELGLKWAELNVFYGKRGYSVVITPKSGSSREVAEIVYTVLTHLFN